MSETLSMLVYMFICCVVTGHIVWWFTWGLKAHPHNQLLGFDGPICHDWTIHPYPMF